MPAIPSARFGHVNVVARDWRRLAAFYTSVFGCEFVPPERDYAGPDLAAGTTLPGARQRGVHLRLPGGGPDGPTLEIYTYDAPPYDGAAELPTVHQPGFGHIAFAVDDVRAARQAVLAAGGEAVGEVVESVASAGQRVTWCYCRDPEGNVVELQRWSDAA
ncbi:MAG: VOC family protein [Bacteroidota bacterium]